MPFNLNSGFLFVVAGAVLMLILMIRTLTFCPVQKEGASFDIRPPLDAVALAERLAQMIRLETVSNHDPALTDFTKFEDL